ncbi:peptide-methionine (R)-S-oxide reductase [Aridibaculum aurantiacum]|uniref:peptide-methionine (R)-S-oxide reductase n=1 Tax=Aridibaculum aurantiacum TaxID=2810307 RepID=UPI001A971991|nr:peptide-methionine (R)-S-oxide reductase [Aridibaculum aurantiacum]
MFHLIIDIDENKDAAGVYGCSNCGATLFTAKSRFNAGCGFPSFYQHIEDHVVFKPLDTYGRHRIQLLCRSCGQHLGHLFKHASTPTKVRYCINEKTISYLNN